MRKKKPLTRNQLEARASLEATLNRTGYYRIKRDREHRTMVQEAQARLIESDKRNKGITE